MLGMEAKERSSGEGAADGFPFLPLFYTAELLRMSNFESRVRSLGSGRVVVQFVRPVGWVATG